jgi:hypothetical protein
MEEFKTFIQWMEGIPFGNGRESRRAGLEVRLRLECNWFLWFLSSIWFLWFNTQIKPIRRAEKVIRVVRFNTGTKCRRRPKRVVWLIWFNIGRSFGLEDCSVKKEGGDAV